MCLYDVSMLRVEVEKLPQFFVRDVAGRRLMDTTATEFCMYTPSNQQSQVESSLKGGWLMRVSWNPQSKKRVVFEARRSYTVTAVVRDRWETEFADSDDEESVAPASVVVRELDIARAECSNLPCAADIDGAVRKLDGVTKPWKPCCNRCTGWREVQFSRRLGKTLSKSCMTYRMESQQQCLRPYPPLSHEEIRQIERDYAQCHSGSDVDSDMSNW